MKRGDSPFLGDTAPTFIDDADAITRAMFPNGFDPEDPAHVAAIGELAAAVDVDAPIEVSGDAIDYSRPIVRSVFADGELASSSSIRGSLE